jgi:RHS repeat-associated protein
MEGDNEVNGPGRSYTTEFRQYDPVVGRWWSVDALTGQMPDWSPYNFGFNSPLRYVDPTGLYPDDWVKDKDENVRWRENVNSADDLDPLSGDQYLGKSGIGLDETSGNTLVYNSDGSIDQGVRSMSEFTVTGEATSHGKVMSNPVVKGMRANSKKIRSEALPFARHMTRSTIDGVGYTGAGISAVGTVVTPFAPHLGVGLIAVGSAVSTTAGVASFSMNLLEGNNYSAGADLIMLGVGRYGTLGIKNLKNNYGVINTTDQVVLQTIFDTSVNIVDGFRPKE